MKNSFAILLGLLLFCSSSYAQKRNHGILANAGTIAVGNYEVSYEHRLDKHFSLSTSAIYYEGRWVLWRVYSKGYSLALGVIPKLHIYGRAHENSVYIAPSLRLGYVDHPPTDETEKPDKGILSRLGVNFGYQHVFDFGLMIDLSAGVEHYYNFSLTGRLTRFQSSSERLRFDLRPYFSTAIGYAF